MDLIQHFEEEIDGNLIILSLKNSEWNNFLLKLPLECRRCFIEDTDLAELIKNFSWCHETEMSEILPDDPSIKSWDFWEIITYFLFKEIYKRNSVDWPKKWQLKESKNVAAPYSDVILYSIKDMNNYSEDDLLISIESKMKATANRSRHPIQLAIDWAKKDHITRRANSLAWLKKVYKTEASKWIEQSKYINLVKQVERFINSEEFGEYSKVAHAIALVEQSFLPDEKVKVINIPSELGVEFKVHLVWIENIKEMYEKLYSEIKKLW